MPTKEKGGIEYTESKQISQGTIYSVPDIQQISNTNGKGSVWGVFKKAGLGRKIRTSRLKPVVELRERAHMQIQI